MGKYQGKFEKRSGGRPAEKKPKAKLRKAPPLMLFLLLWAAGALPELLLHIAATTHSADIWNEGLLLSVMFSAVPALVIFALVMIMPWEKAGFALCITYSGIYFLLCASQLVYFRVFGCFYSFFSMSNGGQVLQFWNIVVKKILSNILWFVAMALPLVVLCWRGWKTFRFGRIRPIWLASAPVSLAVILQMLLLLAMPLLGGKGDLSPYSLYYSTPDAYYSINKLGWFTAFRLDMLSSTSGEEPEGTVQLNPSVPGFDDFTIPTSPQQTAPTDPTDPTAGTLPEETEPTQPPVDTSPNVLDIDFESLIAGEEDKSIREVHQYFAGRSPSNKNEYTGLFAGKNLIMITAEAFSHLAIDPELTPTLYKLSTEGFQFTNYYVPDWGTSTTDGEYGFLTGTVPKTNVWSFSKSSDNAMPLTMSRQLIKLGYNAYAFHGHTYTYYDRDEYLTNLGFYYRGYGGSSDGKTNGLPIRKTWPESDLEVVDVTTGDYMGNSPFVTYYMSISGHREFTFYDNWICNHNKEAVTHLPYSAHVQAYLACQLEFEYSMELMLQRLEEAGILENTVIVITADHYPNGLTVEEMSELAGHEIDTDFEMYKNACIIWTPNMESRVIDAPCSHLDLLPTLSNLFGLEFDSRLYMGRDVFSDAPALVMFRNRNWITDYATYVQSTKTVTNLTETEMTDAYVQAVCTELSNRFTISTRILDKDYWAVLFPEE